MQTEWFRQKLAEKKMSQSKLARNLGMHPSGLSLILRGHRGMSPEVAHLIAQSFGVTVTEVLRRSGIDVNDDVRSAPISASVDGYGNITLFPARTHDRVSGPADCPAGTYAIQVRAQTSIQDGWLIFVSPAQFQAPELLDRICVVTLERGAQVLAVLRRGYRGGAFNLVLWPSGEVLHDQNIAWASPVLWIKPS